VIAVTLNVRELAIQRAQQWLEGISPLTREAKALRSLGLLCCSRILSGRGLRGRGGSARFRLPTTRDFVTGERAKTLAVCRSISLASARARSMDPKRQAVWSETFGGVALSYARAGDPSTTAALLRASAQLGLEHPWLMEAERFLLAQQTPEGCFGLFARELQMVRSEEPPWMPYLNFSVEVLWALAEVTALHAGHEQGNGDRAEGSA